jgi:nicotinamidase/pyrazinamidase
MEFYMDMDYRRTAFLAVDVQNDFCPGGALAVADGDAVAPVVNRLAYLFPLCVATQDWHPAGHVSFASAHPGKAPFDAAGLGPDGRAGTLWPDHCIQDSHGAAFHPRLDERPFNFVIRKGFRIGLDSYSAFFENDGTTPTGLDGLLRGLGMDTVVLAGLAFDYCVFFSAMDAKRLGYKVFVVVDATRPVDTPPGNAVRTEAQMRESGIFLIQSSELLG